MYVALRMIRSAILPFALGLLAGLIVLPTHQASASDISTAPLAGLVVNDSARESLKPALAEAARLLEIGQYRVFIETFMAPEQLAELKKGDADTGEMAEVLQEVQKRTAQLVLALRVAHCMEPTTPEADKAYFEFDPPIQTGDPGGTLIPAIPMRKIGRYWYIGH